MIADAYVTQYHKGEAPNVHNQMLCGSTHVPQVEIIQDMLNNTGILVLMHPDTLKYQWDKYELDPQMHMLMESGTKCVKVTKDMCTLLNRSQMKLYLKILSFSAAKRA